MLYLKFARTACFVVLLTFGFQCHVHAGIVIDDFTTGQFSDNPNPNQRVFDHIDMGSMLGGQRHAHNQITNFASASPTIEVNNGSWCLSNTSGGIQEVSVTYGRQGTATSDPVLNLDLSTGDQFFEFDIASADLNTPIRLRVWSGIDEGNLKFGSFSYVANPAVTTPQTVRADFSQFGAPGLSSGVDFTDVDGITLILEFPNHEFCLTEFRTGAATASIPEPSSLWMLSSTMCFLLRRRRV